MAKKTLLFMLFLICISFASAEDVEVNLTNTNYGVGELFEGYIYLESDTLIDVDEELIGDVKSCGSYSDKRMSLFDLLNNSDFMDDPYYTYTQSGSTQGFTYAFNNDDYLVGFYIQNILVNSLKFDISGNGGPFQIDIGDDGIDYQYVGIPAGYSSTMYPEGIDASYTISDGIDEHDPGQIVAVEYITVPHSGLVADLDLKVSVQAKKTIANPTGTLSARVGSNTCEFTGITNSWSEVSCVVTKTASQNPLEVPVKIIAGTQGEYMVPHYPGTNYYFATLKTALFSENLGSTVEVNDSSLKNAVNNYKHNNCLGEDWCLVPVRLNMVGSGSATLNNLDIVYGASHSSNFYTLTESVNEVNVSGLEIPLSSFTNLLTPGVSEDCLLEIEFGSEKDLAVFNVSSMPIAVIDSSSYSARGVAMQFDGGLSSSENKTITNYKWDFGDSSIATQGKIVTHIYTIEDDYTVTLNVTDSAGNVDSVTKSIHIISLENHLDTQLPVAVNQVQNLLNYFPGLNDPNINNTYNVMSYGAVLSSANISLNNLYSNFTAIKANTTLPPAAKNTKYSLYATELENIKKITPRNIDVGEQLDFSNIILTTMADVFSYEGMGSFTSSEIPYYLGAIYEFNQNNVDVSMDSTLVRVDFLEGSSSFMLVEKSVVVSSGSNNVLVEDLRNYDINNVKLITTGGTLQGSVATWPISGNSISVGYMVFDVTTLSKINSIVHSSINYYVPPILWNESCASGSCNFKWCGDGLCTEDYEGETSCAEDCAAGAPSQIYILLGLFLLFGILYLNFYQGPGNFKDVTNRFSVGVFNKRLFTNDNDLSSLKDYVSDVLKKGYQKDQVRAALVKKGWNEKQIDFAFSNK